MTAPYNNLSIDNNLQINLMPLASLYTLLKYRRSAVVQKGCKNGTRTLRQEERLIHC